MTDGKAQRPEESATVTARRNTGPKLPRSTSLVAKLEHYSIPEPNSGCLLWMGGSAGIGYGVVHWQGRQHPAHRMAWFAVHGEPPKGMHVCHKCDVPACINVAHLFLGTDADNAKDKARKGRATGVLSAEDVVAIRADTRTGAEIAAEFGICRTTIDAARRRKFYAWV